MPEDELEKTMERFIKKEIDILCCTTIIESGIDVPNANTLIVDRADRFGLAELYQLRGRVGRYNRQAYAYFLIPPHSVLTSNVRERIAAIKKYSALGAGFRIAMRDLEIRGCGNLLGTEQSGYINAVGFELYCHYLKVAAAALKGEKISYCDSPKDIYLDFAVFGELKKKTNNVVECFIPEKYILPEKIRIAFHRRLAMADNEDEINKIKEELGDRFGKLPKTVEYLCKYHIVRANFAKTSFDSLYIKNGVLKMKDKNEKYFLINGQLPQIKASSPQSRFDELNAFITTFLKT
jgi:transcription-repair coupling factor (superfamily II helicase)